MPNTFQIAPGSLKGSGTYACFPCVCWCPASAKRVAPLFSGRCDLPCASTYAHFLVFATPGLCKAGRALFRCWVRPALRKDLCMFSLCLLLPGLCKAGRALFRCWVRPALRKAGRAFFSGRKLLSATCLAQGGSHFFSGWPDYLHF